ncbi:hypothetical protein A2763_01440 [Candidatus Kaiserbacteria bacterium RIFCSPHIGHO2_01_FULL_54_36]|uniref:Uncharacterized protein n=1 Tax=Candidatus Kaiserbacteria bacterium RIFCSPHIGHO2_01_FULL_54_36 TaxID=1798482 RepID=A0A1F6CML9_9BACT|nr:MAG: hypothetical protein A2763_01440 [Candidatus Kaiserbacteria bacterium RIFCSPHIGHO2_01_FULL_54_36]OGG75779.1 MAG: hypothetical protein A3A41_00210 [Candidatus Kaiserbacteria bacterium RIFCSPLOWO2_01_FULL_54_22]
MGIVIPWEPFCLTARFRLDEIKYCWEATIFFGAFETSECAYEWFDGIKPLIPEDIEDLGKHVYAYGWREVWDLEPVKPMRWVSSAVAVGNDLRALIRQSGRVIPRPNLLIVHSS